MDKNVVTVSATIDFFGSRQAPFNLQDFPRSNNVSGLMSRDVDMRRGAPLFLLRGEDGNGGDKLDTGAVFAPAGGYPGFISADTNPVTLQVSSVQDIEGFVIAFDSVVREYTKAMTLRFSGENNTPQERIIPNQNFLFGYRFEEPVRSFSLEITEWSAPHRPVRITAFSLNYHMDLTAGEIISLEASREMVADNSEPSYGVVGQYGKLEILDSQGIMLDFARYGVLENNLPCKITIKRNNGDEVFGEYLTGNWTTEFGTGTVSVELRDETDSWNDISVAVPRQSGNNRLETNIQLLEHLLRQANVDIIDIVDGTPITTLFDGYELERDSLTTQLSKLAWLNQLAIYKAPNGKITIEKICA